MRIPPRIKIFLWHGRLLCTEQIAKCHRPSNGDYGLCGEVEGCSDIFFGCSLAKLMWAGVKETCTVIGTRQGRRVLGDLSGVIPPIP
jgi:hypothetical protein